MVLFGLTMMFLHFDDIHTYANSDEVRNTHLSLDLRLDFEKKIISGVCELTLAYEEGKHPAYVDLDSDGLVISAVSAGDGTALRHETGERSKQMGARLRIFLPTEKPDKIRITYATSPGAEAVQFLEAAQTTSGKFPCLFTQGQSIFTRTWIPCMDSPGVRVTYDAVIRVPVGMTAVMSAKHGKNEPENGIFRFRMDLPIPSYLIALAAGEIAFKAVSARTGVYAEPAVLEKAAWEFADMEKMLKAAETLYGAYRWERWDAIVLPPSFPFGGMENPMLTFVTPTLIAGDRSLVSTMAHELAHSWSGNLVTNATWADFWLNEGITTYFERRIDEVLYGAEVAEMQKILGQGDFAAALDEFKDLPGDTVLHIDLAGRHPDDGFSDIPYEKGSNLLLLLETHFGREKFDRFLAGYFDHFAFQSIETTGFLEYLKRNLFAGDEGAWKALQVDRWVYEPGRPENMVIPTSAQFEATKAAVTAFTTEGTLEGVDKAKWSTAQWLYFLNGLPRVLDHEKLALLERRFSFSETGNAEILFAWLKICIPSNEARAWPSVEKFLTRQGRRKFLKPLYEALMANPDTRDLAARIYRKARAGYHPIARTTIDEIVK